jgi:hypothetical protein
VTQPEAIPQSGGTWMRMPDGSLVRIDDDDALLAALGAAEASPTEITLDPAAPDLTTE